jgi:hypothetical protein
VASWLIFRVAHSLRIDSDRLVVRALKISQLTDGGMPPTYETMHWSMNKLRPLDDFLTALRGLDIDPCVPFSQERPSA